MRPAGDVVDTCVAIDPSVSSTEDADECGIIVASGDRRDGKRGMVVHEDASDQLSTQKWAARAVDLYHQYRANVIVAEGNQGGDLVKDVIHNIDPNIRRRDRARTKIEVRAAPSPLRSSRMRIRIESAGTRISPS